MRLIITIFAMMLCTWSQAFSQKPASAVEGIYFYFTSPKMKSGYSTELFNGLTSAGVRISNTSTSFLVIEATINIGPTRTIEAMDVKSVSNTKISLQLINNLSRQKEKKTFSYNIHVTPNVDLSREVIRQFVHDEKAIKELKSIMQTFNQEAHSNCASYHKILTESNDKVELFAKFKLIESLKRNEICTGELSKEISAIENEYLKSVCEQVLYESQILVNSNDPISQSKAVHMLIKIPPKAPCRSEAIKISESLRDNTKLQRSEKKIIESYIHILKVNPNGWIGQF